ncbi:hypothetical protein BGZ46_006071 [Entomortierella lignicola]|nr:hypothetical protein BGZ46_006071 [Entomortierella lignicola]
MRFTILATAIAFTSAVLAQVNPSHPRQGDIWIPNKKFTISWTPSAPSALPIQLLGGSVTTAQKVIADLGTAAAGSKSLTITVPDEAVGWYSIRIGDSYSHVFAIQKDAKTPPSTPEPVAPNTTTIATPLPTANVTSTSASVTKALPTNATTATATPQPTKTTSGAVSGYLNAMPLAAGAVAVVLSVMTL